MNINEITDNLLFVITCYQIMTNEHVDKKQQKTKTNRRSKHYCNELDYFLDCIE